MERWLALVDLGDGFEDGGVIEDLFLVDAASDQSGNAQAVDLAGEAASVLEDTFEGIVTERRTGDIPGDAQVVLNVLEGLFEVQGRELVRVGQALTEGFVDGQAQGMAEEGGTDEQEGGQRAAVHVGAKEQAELLESSGRQQVGFVEDEQGEALLGTNEVFESGADAGDHSGLAEGWFVAEGCQDIPVEASDAEGGVGQVDGQVAVWIEGGDEAAHGGGLAATDLAGDQTQALFVDQVGQACAQLGLTPRGEDIGGRNVFGERDAGKAIELLKHINAPWVGLFRWGSGG